MAVEIVVERGDVTEVASDLLLLKFARMFHGADETVALRLIKQGVCREDEISPAVGQFALVETRNAVAPKRVLFLGVSQLRYFSYHEIGAFAQRAVGIIAEEEPPVRTMTVTVHGPTYGLDIEESLQAMLLGFQQGLAAAGDLPLERIVFVERDERHFDVLAAALKGVECVAQTRFQ